jgi:ferrochelatase
MKHQIIAEKLSLPRDKYEVTFQSRLTNNWLEPFSDDVLKELFQIRH